MDTSKAALEAYERQRAELIDELARGDAAGRLDEVTPLLRDSIGLSVRSPTSADTAVGASRLGGVPDLPEDGWPGDDARWTFVGQIRLEQVAPLDINGLLPHDGLLSFFYGMGAGADLARVLHLPLQGLAPFSGPANRSPSRPMGVDFFPRVEPPPFGSRFLDGKRIEETYMRFFQSCRPSDDLFHGMLGYDLPDQALLPQSSEMLLRLDASQNVPFDFIEASAVYFMIVRDALAAKSFDVVSVAFGDVG